MSNLVSESEYKKCYARTRSMMAQEGSSWSLTRLRSLMETTVSQLMATHRNSEMLLVHEGHLDIYTSSKQKLSERGHALLERFLDKNKETTDMSSNFAFFVEQSTMNVAVCDLVTPITTTDIASLAMKLGCCECDTQLLKMDKKSKAHYQIIVFTGTGRYSQGASFVIEERPRPVGDGQQGS